MQLHDIIERVPVPPPWSEGEKIPWNDESFSQRMLHEHLTQEHDAASRRFPIIDRHVEWIHMSVLGGNPAKILDLGCGPGLYSNRLALLGHTCTGIDFSPASIDYAQNIAREQKLTCVYRLEDIRTAEYGEGYDLAMLIFGELNAFHPTGAKCILQKSNQAIKPAGRLLLEVSTFESAQEIGNRPPTWYSSLSGLYSDRPHLVLQECFWDEAKAVATERYYAIETESGEVTRYISSIQAYTDEQYRELLVQAGFTKIEFIPSLLGEFDPTQQHLVAILAQK